MVKDEDNKKKMFNFVKRLKDNTRRNSSGRPLTNTTSALNSTSESSNTNPTDNQETARNVTSTTNQTVTATTESKSNPPTETNENNCSICLRENNVSPIVDLKKNDLSYLII